MILIASLICFLINELIHQNLLVSFQNTAVLILSLIFYLKLSGIKISLSLRNTPRLLSLIALAPIFYHQYDTIIYLFALALNTLLIAYLYMPKIRSIIVLLVLLVALIATLYSSNIINSAHNFQPNQLLISDNQINNAIIQVQNEATYLPYKIRLIVFSQSVYLYLLLSKFAGFFTLKNLYDTLLIANLYPLLQGFRIDFKHWNKSKTLLILFIFVVFLFSSFSRTSNIFPTFLLINSGLIYFIGRGFASINQKVYLALILFSIFVATSPLQ